MNRELLVAADKRGKVDVERVRADKTVVEADIKYPTDSGLLTPAMCRIASQLRRLRAAGVKVSFVDRTSARASTPTTSSTPSSGAPDANDASRISKRD